jgi:crotonobetainyl-CoA:carnitine CoA-transferase CaiB-like acyl-CoA transferase
MIEGEFQILGDAYIDYFMNGRERRRCGNEHQSMAPHDVFACLGEDAWVAIAVENDQQWAALCRVMGRGDLVADPKFAPARARHENRAELRGPIETWTRARTPGDAQEALQVAGVPAGAVLTAMDLLSDPHVAARNGLNYVDVPGVGPTPYPRIAFTMSGTPVPIAKAAPGFGEDNDYVFGELLGLAAAEIADLERDRITAREPLS